MLSFLSSIADSFVTVVRFIISAITGILSIFGLIGQCFAFLGTAWILLPSVLQVFCIAAITIIIVYQLIGR